MVKTLAGGGGRSPKARRKTWKCVNGKCSDRYTKTLAFNKPRCRCGVDMVEKLYLMSRNIRKLKRAFSEAQDPRLRDRIRAQIDAAERTTALAERLMRQREKNARAQELADRAEEIKQQGLRRREEQARAARAAEVKRKRQPAPERTACTCRKPRVGRDGKCSRCHKVPAGRRRGFWS